MRKILIWPTLLVLLPSSGWAESEIQGPVLGSGGGSVETQNHSLHYTIGQPVVGSVSATDHQLVAGFWRLASIVTAIGPGTPSATPLADRLHQNVPNPFNPATVVSYELADGGHVRVIVYDVTGRQVTTLIDKHQNAGRHSLTWRGITSDGTPAASGIYLFVLDTPHARFTTKSVLLK